MSNTVEEYYINGVVPKETYVEVVLYEDITEKERDKELTTLFNNLFLKQITLNNINSIKLPVSISSYTEYITNIRDYLEINDATFELRMLDRFVNTYVTPVNETVKHLQETPETLCYLVICPSKQDLDKPLSYFINKFDLEEDIYPVIKYMNEFRLIS